MSASIIGDGRRELAGRRQSHRKTDLTNIEDKMSDYQDIIEDRFHSRYRNTIIPDEIFGPDEERIFIDIDPHDLDESVFGLQRNDDINLAIDVVTENAASKLKAAKPDIDYIEESLKNVKRYWQESRDESKGQWSTTTNGHVRSDTISESVTSPENAYYIEDSNTKRETPNESRGFADDSDKSINHHDTYGGNTRTENSSIFTSTTMSRSAEEDRLKILEELDSHHSPSHANQTIDYSDVFEEESDKQKIEQRMDNHTNDYTTARFPAIKDPESKIGEDLTTLIDDRGMAVVEENTDEDVRNLSRNRENHSAGSVERTSTLNLKEFLEEGKQRSDENKSASVSISSSTREGDTTKDPFMESLSVLGKNCSMTLH